MYYGEKQTSPRTEILLSTLCLQRSTIFEEACSKYRECQGHHILDSKIPKYANVLQDKLDKPVGDNRGASLVAMGGTLDKTFWLFAMLLICSLSLHNTGSVVILLRELLFVTADSLSRQLFYLLQTSVLRGITLITRIISSRKKKVA